MKIRESYQPVSDNFYDYLKAAAAQKKYVRIHYFTPLHELMKEMSVIKDLFLRDREMFIRLASGEEIRLNQLVRIDHLPAPGHDGEDGYSCAC